MSLTLPIQALGAMQVSFKVELADGKFAFDMIHANSAEIPGAQSEGGAKLHLCAVRDSAGVTLTVRVSRDAEGQMNAAGLGGVYEMNSQPIPLSEPREPSLEHTAFPSTAEADLNNADMDFVSPSPKSPDGPFRQFDLPDVSNFNMAESLFSALTEDTLYDYREDYLNFDIPSAEGRADSLCTGSDLLSKSAIPHLDIFEGMSDKIAEGTPHVSPSISNSSITDDSSSSVPSTPSDIPTSPRGSSRSRGSYRCPEPACQRNFKSQYTLSKHAQAHRPKTHTPFPCTMGCALEFSRKHDRLRHEVSQHGRVCAKCGACRAFFSSEETLNKHKCKIRARPY